MSFIVPVGTKEEKEEQISLLIHQEIRVLLGLKKKVIPLNGGSQTRRDAYNYYKSIYPDKYFEVIYRGYEITIKGKHNNA